MSEQSDQLLERLGGNPYVRMRSFRRENEIEDILLRDLIYFGSVRSQDDIYEGRPNFRWFDTDVSAGHVYRLARRNMRWASEQEVRDKTNEIMALAADPIQLAVWQGWNEISLEKLYSTSSICSFFRSAKKQQFWASYGDGGTGYALIFDFSIPWRYVGVADSPESNWVPFKVNYVDADRRPAVDLHFGPTTGADGWNMINRALLMKSNEWAGQGEWRLVRLGLGAGQVAFPASSLCGVVLGYGVSPENERRTVEIARNRPIPLPVVKAAASSTGYQLTFRPLL